MTMPLRIDLAHILAGEYAAAGLPGKRTACGRGKLPVQGSAMVPFPCHAGKPSVELVLRRNGYLSQATVYDIIASAQVCRREAS